MDFDIRRHVEPYGFFLSLIAFGLAIGFAKFYNKFVYLPSYSVSLPPNVVYFPFFPNILDSIALLLIAAYLMWVALRTASLPSGRHETHRTEGSSA